MSEKFFLRARLAENFLRLVRGGGRLGAAPAWLNIKLSSLASPEVAKRRRFSKSSHPLRAN